MRESSSGAGAPAQAIPGLPGPACGRLVVSRPARLSACRAMTPRLSEDHDRIAGGDDKVVHQLFSAGLAVEAALGLIGEHVAVALSRARGAPRTGGTR